MTESEFHKIWVWLMYLPHAQSQVPAYYYNPQYDVFQKEFTYECVHLSEYQCRKRHQELGLDQVVLHSGVLRVPSDALIEDEKTWIVVEGTGKVEWETPMLRLAEEF